MSATTAYDFVMMALVNMDDPDLVVLPTHRVADAPGTFDADSLQGRSHAHFDDRGACGQATPQTPYPASTSPAFLFKTRERRAPLLARLRDRRRPRRGSSQLRAPHAWKTLDVAVLQELGARSAPRTSTPTGPRRSTGCASSRTHTTRSRRLPSTTWPSFLRPTRMDQLRAVALAGETMPQKSTYFYPKLLSGLVLRSAE